MPRMPLLHPQLEAFLAVLDEGSFERAAKRLAVTPSALSQRIRALEDRLGAVLLKRESPVMPTEAGEKLLLRARSMQLLEAEALSDFAKDAPADAAVRLTIIVNNDSLATWCPEAAAEFVSASAETGTRVALDIRTDDQDHALESLRSGAAIAAVAADESAVAGARVRSLGVMRYRAWASRAFIGEAGGISASTLARLPIVSFDRKDALQMRFLERSGVAAADFSGVVHYLPSPSAMLEATARGLGWSMAPEALARPYVERGALVEIDAARPVDVPLFWQCAAIRSSLLERLTRIVMRTAQKHLLPG